MFHRVLSTSDPQWGEADPAWTISDTLFEECLLFFREHYNVIGLADLVQWLRDGVPPSDRPLLITFDDGWADNEVYALKVLKKTKLPAIVFVVSDGIGKAELWAEAVRRVWRKGLLTEDRYRTLWKAAGSEEPVPHAWRQPAGVHDLVARLGDLGEAEREALLAREEVLKAPGAAQMLSLTQLIDLHNAGIAIGSHGTTHTPMAETAHLSHELRTSRLAIGNLLGSSLQGCPVSLSFPHGSYNSRVIHEASEAGYRLLFTSDPHLNPLDRISRPAVLGRIPVSAQEIAGETGVLSPELLALWLFTRPSVSPISAKRASTP
jgi:peptidoglycan/xylan/chitin deacetylase (PgdA/CDA1 family)